MTRKTITNSEKEMESPKENESILRKKQEQYFIKKRAVFLWQGIDEDSAKDIVNKLLLLNYDNSKEPIKLYINSPGGVVTHGMVIYDTMQLIDAPVHTVCMGLAASMASLLLSGGEKGNRFIYPNGEVMIHQPLLGGHLQAVSKDLEIEAQQMGKTKQLLTSIIAKHSKHNVARVLKDIDRNYWMDAHEAIAYGIVDYVATSL